MRRTNRALTTDLIPERPSQTSFCKYLTTIVIFLSTYLDQSLFGETTKGYRGADICATGWLALGEGAGRWLGGSWLRGLRVLIPWGGTRTCNSGARWDLRRKGQP